MVRNEIADLIEVYLKNDGYQVYKAEITGVSYEPWHYRYVGREAAKEIYNQGICLEEYCNTNEK